MENCPEARAALRYSMLQCRLFWHVFLDILHGLTNEILGIRHLLIDYQFNNNSTKSFGILLIRPDR
jgi:hypothetical protein